MTPAEYDDARQIWALTHGSYDLEQVCVTCRFIIDNGLDETTPVYLSLLTSIYVTYSKSFKGAFKLAADLVPQKYKELHDSIIHMRDKAFAHTDRSGLPFAEGYFVHDVGVRIESTGQCSIFISKMWARPLHVPNIFDLAMELGQICVQKRDEILIKNQHLIPSIMGDHVLNVRDPTGPFSSLPKS